MHPRPFAAASLAALALAACSEPPMAPITSLPRPLSSAEAQLVQSANQFSITLFRETLRQAPAAQNVFISPLSFSMALGMTLNGAAGATESAMRHTLALDGMPRDDINAAYRDLIALLVGLDPGVTLNIANSIWYRQDYIFAPAFLETNRTYFGAEVRGLDFAAPGAAQTINQWVSSRTAGRIPEIVASPIPDGAIMYLINAVYFKANWTHRFDAALTQNGAFHLADGGTVSVPMMRSSAPVPARRYFGTDASVLDLPYGGGAFSMTIILPAASLDSLVTRLTPEEWSGWISALDSTATEVVIPRFTLRYDLESAEPVLQALGMTPAFCDDVPPPDFTRLYPSGQACISRVKHKTFVLVDESGTEAAAATSVEIGVTSVSPAFIVDRPFLFVLRERFSGTILFIGRVMNPSSVP